MTSTQLILKAAASVIQNNRSRRPKTLWTENSIGIPLMHYELPDERSEAETLITEAARLCLKENYSFKDLAIFYRTNAQSRQFEDALRRNKIPYQILGGMRFYDRKEIKDVLAYLRVIFNPNDSVSLRRIINTPARGIGKASLERLEAKRMEISQEASLWQSLQCLQSSHGTNDNSNSDAAINLGRSAEKKILAFSQMLLRWQKDYSFIRISELYQRILEETGYLKELRQEATEEALSRVENLEEFHTLILEFEEAKLKSLYQDVPRNSVQGLKTAELLPQFLEELTLSSDLDQMNESSNCMKLLTLHSSKGLEFPVVFMTGMEEGLFPSLKPWEFGDDEEIEEERRLCYVGITRARERLYLSNVMLRRIWGEASYQEPSRFLSEIPSEVFYKVSKTQAIKKTAISQVGTLLKQGELPTEGSWLGRHLIHPQYGAGTIIHFEGQSPDEKVTIQFKGGSDRKFLLKYVSSYCS